MNNVRYNLIKSVVDDFKKGQLGIFLVSEVSCDNKFLAHGRQYVGRVSKVTMISNARLGASYEGMVSAKCDGKVKFTPSKPSGMTWIDYPYFKQADKSGKIYLTLNYRPCDERTKFESYYLIDGHVASVAEVAAIESCMKSSGSGYSAKQSALGVADECAQTRVVQYYVDDVRYVGNNKSEAMTAYLRQ